ncbi:TPA: hypothetical protein SMI69_003253 [Serratia marcescens]|nr:hypothetical protein [Serratia marcescens]
MKNIVENQGIKTDKPLPMSYEALKAERDALAVENAGFKHALSVILEHVDVTDKGQAGVVAMIATDALLNSETPATDAALAAIEARGVDKFSDSQMQKSLEHRAIGNSGLADVYNDNAMDAKVFAMRIREAANLREAK